MKTVGYVAGAFDLFHIGHLNALRYAKSHCDFLIVGVLSDETLRLNKSIKPVIPLDERIEIVRSICFVDRVVVETFSSKLDAWRELHFARLFEGEHTWETAMADVLETDMASVSVEVIHLPHLPSTSSTTLRYTLENINRLTGQMCFDTDPASLEIRRALR
ncbi:adenylyltransferase/cytidyltransferase family protein [Paraburkholderia sediminicola]|uniref:adenylyltransferase/cytidyltransferase family protein n=1 Tax=Paraburkholderia sediminicola TaxID=458836 RepID=UPI0038B92751